VLVSTDLPHRPRVLKTSLKYTKTRRLCCLVFYKEKGGERKRGERRKRDQQTERQCDSLYMLGPGSGTIWKYGLVGVGMALLE
jgi:hypothetical protein